MTRKRYTNTPPTNGKHLYLSREERFARFGRVVGERRDSGRRVGHLDFDDSCADCGHHVCSCDRGESELYRDSSQELESSAIDFEHNGQPFRAKYNGYSWLVTRRPDTGNGYVILWGPDLSHDTLQHGAAGYIECHGDDRARVKSEPAPPAPNLPPLPAGFEWSRCGRYVISELRELACLWGDGQYRSVPHGFVAKARATVSDAIVDALGADASAMFCDRDGWAFGGERYFLRYFFRGQPVNEEALTSATTRGRLLEHEARVLAAERAE